MLQLKQLCPAIIQIWEETSKRGRYSKKWVEWESTIKQMEIDEELLRPKGELTETFKDVDLALIHESKFELHIK